MKHSSLLQANKDTKKKKIKTFSLQTNKTTLGEFLVVQFSQTCNNSIITIEEMYHLLMRNAKLPFIIQSTNLLIGINQTEEKPQNKHIIVWRMGGKKSTSDMLIGNERPFSWAGGQHRCMMGNWLFAEAEDEHGELLLPSPLERKQWRCSHLYNDRQWFRERKKKR